MLMRLCYASVRLDHQNLLQDLADILTTAMNFNSRNNICGVLYYAHNAFFQCIEGEEKNIRSLFDSIKKDKRHESVILLSTEYIEVPVFKKWSMNYVKANYQIDQFFKARKHSHFCPTALQADEVPEFIQLLLKKSQEVLSDPRSTRGYKRGYCQYIAS